LAVQKRSGKKERKQGSGQAGKLKKNAELEANAGLEPTVATHNVLRSIEPMEIIQKKGYSSWVKAVRGAKTLAHNGRRWGHSCDIMEGGSTTKKKQPQRATSGSGKRGGEGQQGGQGGFFSLVKRTPIRCFPSERRLRKKKAQEKKKR